MPNRAKIIYYVAISLDGYIAGPEEDISLFAGEGNGVEKYLSDLKLFNTVIMGRKTYEFGYKFGLKPGQPAYPHMEHYVFSNSLEIDDLHPNVHIEKLSINRVIEIRDSSSTDVYLCGGGVFAGWLLDHNLIDQLKVKINPIILGDGVRLFGDCRFSGAFKLLDTIQYEKGLQFCTYEIL